MEREGEKRKGKRKLVLDTASGAICSNGRNTRLILSPLKIIGELKPNTLIVLYLSRKTRDQQLCLASIF
jgi:hypothetical protein